MNYFFNGCQIKVDTYCNYSFHILTCKICAIWQNSQILRRSAIWKIFCCVINPTLLSNILIRLYWDLNSYEQNILLEIKWYCNFNLNIFSNLYRTSEHFSFNKALKFFTFKLFYSIIIFSNQYEIVSVCLFVIHSHKNYYINLN